LFLILLFNVINHDNIITKLKDRLEKIEGKLNE